MAWRVGVDIGGTFTDFAALDEGTGRLVIHKQLTTPDDPARCVLAGLPELMAKAGAPVGAIGTLVHGTTLVTNAIIERRGARTGMLVTEGFADVLDIALERRYDLYDLRATYPAPLVPRHLRVEIAERIGADGKVATKLDAQAVRRAVDALVRDHRVEALAICFLNSPSNDAHERAALETVRAAYPSLFVSSSADVFPFQREYERWTTTTMNAFTQPMFDRYIARLESGLASLGFAGQLYVMASSGGVVDPAIARRYPVRMLESGPAAGILMSAILGRRIDARELLAFDMGGTTAKGALVRRGLPLKRYDMEVARVHEFRLGSGLPAKIPVIDLIEIGAGGGSLATLDARGMIAVGPRSAGADPGPVCYARGGAEPTLTDANVALGYLDPEFFLGGAMKLDAPAANAALHARLGARLSIGAAETAWGVHETTNEQVARAFRNHAAERGFDYRAASMVAFGGCGPLHALRIARKLRVPRVIFPVGAGVLSAVGLLASPLAFEIMQTDRIDVAALDAAGFDRRFAALHDRAAGPLADAGVRHEAQMVRRALDMRYRGQGYEIEVALPDGDGASLVAQLPTLFAEAYARVFAKSFLTQPVEIINWKIEVSGPEPAGAGSYRLDAPRGAAARKGNRRAWFPDAGGFVDVAVYDRYALSAGDTLDGPALIEEHESTAVIGVGERVSVDPLGNLVAQVG